jgi:FHA domain-containing protein
MSTGPVTSASPTSTPCPRCGATRTGRERFCETCGFDFAADASASEWAAEIAPDHAYFARVAPEGLAFPAGEVGQTVALDGARITIGRRRPDADDAPEIELGDPAVSRLHATLVRAQDGSWAIVDEGSSNGTRLNADAEPIPAHREIPLRDGDEVHVGAWTTITLALRNRAA